MFNEPRNWKWIVPACVAVVFSITSMLSYGAASQPGWGWLAHVSTIVAGFAIVFYIAALVNLVKYVGEFAAEQLLVRRRAMATNADALILEHAKGVHPDAIRLIFGERQRAWLRHAGFELPEGEEPYCVLYAAPDVTDMFVWHFLRSSNNYRCMAKNRLSDKSYRFDPLRKTQDYEQYDKLTTLLKQRGIITDHFSNGSPLWIPPWRPGLLADDLGLEWVEERDGYHVPDLDHVETGDSDDRGNIER